MLTLDIEADAPVLNQGQQEAADGFFQFLFSPEREMILSGAGGTGKTFVMGHLIDKVMPEYLKTCNMMGIQPEYDSVMMTATTNKAAEVLGLSTKRPTETIHSFLALKVTDDFATGRSKLTKTKGWKVHERKIIFIDEAFMIDSTLLEIIREGTHNCKIVYVGDHCQLAPVMETTSPIERQQIGFFKLTQNVRNAGQPALMDICQQLRETVETGVFQPIHIVPGVIDLADDNEMSELIEQTFHDQNREARILAYTNKRVVEYNDHIRNVRHLADEYGKGELLVNNQAIRIREEMLSVEEEVEIVHQDARITDMEIAPDAILRVRYADLKSRLGSYYNRVPLPIDREHFSALSRYYSQRKQWDRFFYMKNTFPDLRPRDAATVHKAQGSTHDMVFIDLSDISRCHQPQTAARLLYVAFTRARSRVILYGDLTDRYGGLIQA